MSTPIDNLNRPPTVHASVTTGAEASGADVEGSVAYDLRPLGPQAAQGAIYVRWMGSGAATLWYKPLAPRNAYSASEGVSGVPKDVANVGSFIRLDFAAQYEGQFLQASHIHGDSTAGTWVFGY